MHFKNSNLALSTTAKPLHTSVDSHTEYTHDLGENRDYYYFYLLGMTFKIWAFSQPSNLNAHTCGTGVYKIMDFFSNFRILISIERCLKEEHLDKFVDMI